MLKITEKEFAKLVGSAVSDLPRECRELLVSSDLSFIKVSAKKRDEIILNVLKKINSEDLTISGKTNKSTWERGWKENLSNFANNNYDLQKLTPQYVRPNLPMRLLGQYVIPNDPKFELHFYTIFRIWFFKKYLNNIKVIYEFGCGSGYNLPILAKLFPKAKIHGLDWIPESRIIVNKIGSTYKLNVKGHVFDMFNPDVNFKLAPNSAVLTLGSLEQLGDNFHKFLKYIFKQSPSICLHYEPLIELYNENSLFDYLAVLYHKKRNYLGNFLTRLKGLEAENKIRILKYKRLMGSLYHDGSIVIWKLNK